MRYFQDLKSRLLSRKLAGSLLENQVILDSQHINGQFDFLYSIEEIGHYMIIVGYLPYIHRNPRILDVGCGQGRLFQLLDSTSNYHRYVGIDFSKNAIHKAKRLGNHKSTFELIDFEVWEPDNTFDAIIFNESIYYTNHPRDILCRYGTYLSSDGAMIVSILRYFGNEKIWDGLDQDFNVIAGSQVQNLSGQIWDIKVLRPKTDVGQK